MFRFFSFARSMSKEKYRKYTTCYDLLILDISIYSTQIFLTNCHRPEIEQQVEVDSSVKRMAITGHWFDVHAKNSTGRLYPCPRFIEFSRKRLRCSRVPFSRPARLVERVRRNCLPNGSERGSDVLRWIFRLLPKGNSEREAKTHLSSREISGNASFLANASIPRFAYVCSDTGNARIAKRNNIRRERGFQPADELTNVDWILVFLREV